MAENEEKKVEEQQPEPAEKKQYRIAYNDAGIWVTEDGFAFEDEEAKKPIPLEPYNDYYIVENKYLAKPDPKYPGKFIHRMVVYTFGDKNGKSYVKGYDVDHVDMDHSNNAVWNLEQIPHSLNLARAVVITPSEDKDGTDEDGNPKKQQGTSMRLFEYLRSLYNQDPAHIAFSIHVGIIERSFNIDLSKYNDIEALKKEKIDTKTTDDKIEEINQILHG